VPFAGVQVCLTTPASLSLQRLVRIRLTAPISALGADRKLTKTNLLRQLETMRNAAIKATPENCPEDD